MKDIVWPDYTTSDVLEPNTALQRILRVQLGDIALVRLTEDLLDTVRQWRNDPDVNRYLFTREAITSAQQRRWFEQVSADPCQWHCVACFRDTPIGACYLRVNVDDQTRAESSYYLAPGRYRQTAIAFLPALLLHDTGLRQSGLSTIEARVMRDNQAAIRFNQHLGYVDMGGGTEIVHMQLTLPAHLSAYQRIHTLALRKRRTTDQTHENNAMSTRQTPSTNETS